MEEPRDRIHEPDQPPAPHPPDLLDGDDHTASGVPFRRFVTDDLSRGAIEGERNGTRGNDHLLRP